MLVFIAAGERSVVWSVDRAIGRRFIVYCAPFSWTRIHLRPLIVVKTETCMCNPSVGVARICMFFIIVRFFCQYVCVGAHLNARLFSLHLFIRTFRSFFFDSRLLFFLHFTRFAFLLLIFLAMKQHSLYIHTFLCMCVRS